MSHVLQIAYQPIPVHGIPPELGKFIFYVFHHFPNHICHPKSIAYSGIVLCVDKMQRNRRCLVVRHPKRGLFLNQTQRIFPYQIFLWIKKLNFLKQRISKMHSFFKSVDCKSNMIRQCKIHVLIQFNFNR